MGKIEARRVTAWGDGRFRESRRPARCLRRTSPARGFGRTKILLVLGRDAPNGPGISGWRSRRHDRTDRPTQSARTAVRTGVIFDRDGDRRDDQHRHEAPPPPAFEDRPREKREQADCQIQDRPVPRPPPRVGNRHDQGERISFGVRSGRPSPLANRRLRLRARSRTSRAVASRSWSPATP